MSDALGWILVAFFVAIIISIIWHDTKVDPGGHGDGGAAGGDVIGGDSGGGDGGGGGD